MSERTYQIIITIVKIVIAIICIAIAIYLMYKFIHSYDIGDVKYDVITSEELENENMSEDEDEATPEEIQKARDQLDQEILDRAHAGYLPENDKAEKIRNSVEQLKEFKDYVKTTGDYEYVDFSARYDDIMFKYTYNNGNGVFYVHTDEKGNFTWIEDTTSYKDRDVLDAYTIMKNHDTSQGESNEKN